MTLESNEKNNPEGLEALYNAVIVLPTKVDEVIDGGIIIADAGAQTNEFGEVVAVGPGQYNASGYVPTTLSIGDVVILPTMGFTRFMYKDVEYYVGPENSVLGKINKQ